MFDIGFWEIMLIAVMGLVVLGPERLPTAIRTVRGWISGARKLSESVKNELSEELRIHELHANLKKAEQTNMSNLSPEVAESLKTLQKAADMVNEPFKSSVDTNVIDNSVVASIDAPSKSTSNDDISSANTTSIDKPKT
jgi:sec-independent protein translocase protein TatB